MDRAQHQRYLAYLQKYDYFGRGKPRLDLAAFVAAETEFLTLAPPGDDEARVARRRELATLLLRD